MKFAQLRKKMEKAKYRPPPVPKGGKQKQRIGAENQASWDGCPGPSFPKPCESAPS